MSLHLVFSIQGFAACQDRCTAQDQIVLLADGAYCAVRDNLPNPSQVHVMAEDLAIRGLAGTACANISYADLVLLCTLHKPIVSWND